MSITRSKTRASVPRLRLTREQRRSQLLEVAWSLVRAEGTQALTLGRLAEHAGVAKPVVYSHFRTREALLVTLYAEFDARQTALMDAALQSCAPTPGARAEVIASSYVDCVLSQGRELPGVIAALASSPALEQVRREWEVDFMRKCRAALFPPSRGSKAGTAGLRGMLGAAEALSYAAATGEISAAQAKKELTETIRSMVDRHARGKR